MLRFRSLMLGLSLFVLLVLPWTFIQAKEVVSVTVSGPGLAGETELTELDQIEPVAEMRTLDRFGAAPESIGEQFFVLGLNVGTGQEVVATTVYHYYPTTDPDVGYLYYADVINGSSDAEGDWFRLDAASNRALREVLFNLIVSAASE
ncbi:MAG: hypothetical protein JNM70_07425 [Anaerolineae bacterium]|nr:hypothetical protein [Anaerolineae bacterium]